MYSGFFFFFCPSIHLKTVLLCIEFAQTQHIIDTLSNYMKLSNLNFFLILPFLNSPADYEG